MAEQVNILGLDPGFQNIGYTILKCTPEKEEILYMGIFRTEKADKKRKVLAVDDNFRRTKEIAEFLCSTLAEWNIKAICAEAISHPRNAGAAAKVAMTWGVIAAISHLNKIPVIQATPQEIKLAMCGIKSASKEEVEASVKTKVYVGNFLTKVAKSHQNHAFDAAAAVLTCLKSDVILALRGRL